MGHASRSMAGAVLNSLDQDIAEYILSSDAELLLFSEYHPNTYGRLHFAGLAKAMAAAGVTHVALEYSVSNGASRSPDKDILLNPANLFGGGHAGDTIIRAFTAEGIKVVFVDAPNASQLLETNPEKREAIMTEEVREVIRAARRAGGRCAGLFGAAHVGRAPSLGIVPMAARLETFAKIRRFDYTGGFRTPPPGLNAAIHGARATNKTFVVPNLFPTGISEFDCADAFIHLPQKQTSLELLDVVDDAFSDFPHAEKWPAITQRFETMWNRKTKPGGLHMAFGDWLEKTGKPFGASVVHLSGADGAHVLQLGGAEAEPALYVRAGASAERFSMNAARNYYERAHERGVPCAASLLSYLDQFEALAATAKADRPFDEPTGSVDL